MLLLYLLKEGSVVSSPILANEAADLKTLLGRNQFSKDTFEERRSQELQFERLLT